MRGKLEKKLGEISVDEIDNYLMKLGKGPVASELSTYYLIQWILDHAAEGDGYGFPFDQRYLNFYQRLKVAYLMIKEVNTFYSKTTKNDKIIWKLYHRIKGVCEDYSVLTVSLLRSFGIPALIMSGPMYNSEIGHAWPAFYTPEFSEPIVIDTTWGDTSEMPDYFFLFNSNLTVIENYGWNSDVLPDGYSSLYSTYGNIQVTLKPESVRIEKQN